MYPFEDRVARPLLPAPARRAPLPTFDHGLIDIPDLMTSGGMRQRITYTAVTRFAKSVTYYK
jgi:hypothetical protein